MPTHKIKELGKLPDGRNVRGYELDFTVKEEGWYEYTLEDGTTLRVKHVLLKVFQIVDDNGNPSIVPTGEPEILITSSATVVARKE